MKNLDRNVTLLCPLCGNDQFLSLDEEFEDLLHAGDDARVRCSDCGSEYTKRELLDSNAAIIDNGSASKFRIVTEWTDSRGNQHTKTQMGDFS